MKNELSQSQNNIAAEGLWRLARPRRTSWGGMARRAVHSCRGGGGGSLRLGVVALTKDPSVHASGLFLGTLSRRLGISATPFGICTTPVSVGATVASVGSHGIVHWYRRRGRVSNVQARGRA